MSGYIGTQPVPQATQHRETFTATSSQTTFATVGYTPQFVDVYLNGVHLLDTVDYTATNSSDVVLTTGAAASDVVEIISYTPFEVANQTFTGTTTVDVLTTTGAFTSLGIDDNATSTAMTLDASGNLLVGRTADSNATVGVSLRPDGQVSSSRDGDVSLVLNRNTSDGSIALFTKDGSTVGNIGSNTSGSRLHIGKDNVALSFAAGGANAIIPWDSTANAVEDAALSLGGSTARFKDLYLSGGVYLGGTGSANKLDDYEEGTWSPVFSDATSGGNTATANGGKRGLYTKIGNQVTVSCAATNLNTTGMTGANDLRIQGLPFTPTSYVSPNHYWTGGTRLGVVSFNTNGFVTAYVSDAVTYVRLGETISGSSIDNIICSQLTSGSADISFTMTYQTNA